MHRTLLIIACVFCMVCVASVAIADTRTDLQVIKLSLPTIKTKLDRIKASGQDISYPMVSYTVLENFVDYALTDVDTNATLAATELSELQTIKSDLDQQIAQALAGSLVFPILPRWTGDTRPVISGGSFMAPTITFGSDCREIRPVFFTGFGHFGQVRADMEKWPNYGINMVQFEIGPWSLYGDGTEINPPDLTPVQSIKADLDRAQKAGVAVNLLISPHYFPAWMKAKYPELVKSRSGFIAFCIHAPSGQEFLKEYITELITPIKNHPALHSICLTNEPVNIEEPCEYATAAFHTWLWKRHVSVDLLNRRWGTNYASFDDITIPISGLSAVTTPMGRWADYVRWNQEYFAGWHKILADAVHAVAPNLPVHAKVQDWTFGNKSQMICGNDPYLYAGISQINGNDGSNYYVDPSPYFNEWLGCYMYADLQRSMKDAPVFNSENHMVGDYSLETVLWRHMRTALWQEAIHGQSATTLWVWERSGTPDSQIYGHYMYRPLCTKAVGIVNCDLNRAAKEVTALQSLPEQVDLLYSTSSLIWDTGNEYDYLTMRAYNALVFSKVRTGFISERQLEDGILPKAPVLVVPNAKHLSNAAFATLKNYTGRIIYLVNSSLLAYDEYDKPRSETLNATVLSFTSASAANITALYKVLSPQLISWGIKPKITMTDTAGNQLMAVEYLEASTADGIIVDMCNYYDGSVNVRLSRDGEPVTAVDVLTGETVTGIITLETLEFRLLKIAN
ncbi:beta-galactosidase [bacterium]|nr:beta-galactosidase [bacterium]